MCDSSNRRKTDRQRPWIKHSRDGTELPLRHTAPKWRVGGWVGGLYVKLKGVGMDGKGTLKMFHRKKRELIKTPSISKKSRAGSPGPQSSAPANGDRAVGGRRSMLRRVGKGSYNPYSTSQRVKKAEAKSKDRLDILPSKQNVWLKQLSILQEQPRKDAADITLSSSPLSSASTLTPTSAGLQDSSASCPGTPSIHHSKLVAMQGVGSPVSTLKRPTALSRHASAAGFPLQSWVFSKGQGKTASAPTTPSDGPESTAIEVEDIPALLRDVARFAEAVEKLKDVVLTEGKDSQRPVAHECLGEVLRVLRQVINTYPLLNTVEILTAAGKLISKVKGFHYEACNEADKNDFEKAIETIAVAFSSNVSELLIGEVDSSTLLSQLPTEKSRSLENLYASTGHGADSGHFRNDLHYMGRAEEVDVILQQSEGGVDSALLYAKTISKYMKDLISYVEKRTSLEMEFSKGLQRLYHSCKHSITHPQMPLFSIYSLALEQDQEQSVGLQLANTTLHTQTFIQPLMQRKQEHEKRRKEIKEHWIRAKRKLMECEANLRKAKQAFMVRCEEYEKAKTAACRAEEEGGGSTAKSVEKKKRVEEEARNKSDEAEATYRNCIADATTQQQELEHTKVTVLRTLQDVIKQSDQTLRSATISYYQLMHMQTVALPVHYRLCVRAEAVRPGPSIKSISRITNMQFQIKTLRKPRPADQGIDSFQHGQSYHAVWNAAAGDSRDAEAQRKRQGHKSWGSTVSDDSVGGEAGLESPTASSSDVSKIARTSSTGTMSSNEDADEKDGNMTSFESPNMNGMDPDVVVSTRPFRNVGLSKAAHTHRLRKLRTPSKCRECDSYVYFQGAECEECFLACHKRCLETLAIQCGHKKLQGRLQLFGRDFSQVASCASDGIPFIITKCISEIERRALKMKGIYRVNGVKTRVEKLCQAFENGKELVELSQCSPHDISNVLKLYLRQLPEPIMLFRLYNSLMGLAKESMQGEADTAEGEEVESNSINPAVGKGPELVDLGPNSDPEVLVLVDKLKELLKEPPKANVATLRYIIRHLRRIAELEEDNKMSPSNLGIVFGPSLMRPRPTGATISLSSLVDYPHQARIIECLIVFYSSIFQSKTSQTHKNIRSDSSSAQQMGQEDIHPSDKVCAADEKIESAADGEEPNKPESEKLEEGCGSSLGSLGSSEQLPDSDSEQDDSSQGAAPPRSLVTQESEVSMDDEPLSYRDSLDLSSQSATLTEPEPEPDQDQEETPDKVEPPALPVSGPPDEDTATEEELSVSLAELNVNQSNNNNKTNNNNYPCSPVLSLSGHPLSRLSGTKLPLTRNRDSEPEFV
ncbi:LOW QUALITY PROTEIN: minor histocompatibility protein HA-1 [Notothenia coriiceps]|uniref:LOW QUALITY PROTEIN: minor histocompatibility protein HA-1 n=1 Tax=Notothenia coriiceps TaxID=8208 RepID=A0A6I9NH60_9TELE|nr:PREDICTED: LOW QUALITY PROTEIN: minor histocompatibility protein HA-1 [Notothenia coriiceps]